jgi:signal transduction histidine kinase
VADLCLPIYDDNVDAKARKVVGITKISLDAGWMLRQVDLAFHGDELPRASWLVHSDGRAVPGARPVPPIDNLPDHVARQIQSEQSGWLRAEDVEGYELIGYAAVEQSKLMEKAAQRWHVVVATGVHDVVSSIYRLAWVVFLLGLAVIAACFFGGLVIARREIVRPLRTLEEAVNQLKGGNRDFRLSEARGGQNTFREDEIGRLAHDFNLMADQLSGNIEQLEQADAVKRQFIDLASHELRTPITYILGASQLAQLQNGSANGTIMSKIAAKAQRLNRIVENMFKLLASDRFDRTFRTAPIDVAAMVRTVCQEHEVFFQERKQRCEIEVEPDLPTLEGDPDKIRDILSNLVSNAIRFSPDGGVVRVRAARAAPPEEAVEIAVCDSGPGIPAEDMPNLFQPFFTGAGVEHHSSGDYQHMSRGIGLGLSVVKRFVELHGGSVAVDTSTKGTQIRVKLPIKR